MKIGQGIDVHASVTIPYANCGWDWSWSDAPGLIGHSDADAATHALCDALLGAANLGDLGRHFPDTETAYAGVLAVAPRSDDALIRAGFQSLRRHHHHRGASETLRLMPRMSHELSASRAPVSVKATTSEGLGALGRGEGIAASAVALWKRVVSPVPPAPWTSALSRGRRTASSAHPRRAPCSTRAGRCRRRSGRRTSRRSRTSAGPSAPDTEDLCRRGPRRL